ncbi:MAG: TIM barrel protein [Lacunisphaera sp.]|jgi:hydroxypyruvate isomerase|nr:TIM barrel protein [Lacunisphaera sp.]
MNTKLTRREALQSLAAGLALSALPRSGSAAETPAASGGSFHHSVCKWCYRDIPLAEFAAAVKGFGLESVELLNPEEWPVVQQLGLTCAMANGTTTITKGMNRLEHHAVYVPSMIERIKLCAAAGLPNVILFSGNRGGMSDEQGLENCAIGLKQLMGEAEKRGVTVCMELLNSKVNHKDYMCDRTPWGVELCKRVGSERFKLLYDIYHMQIMEGDVIRTIEENSACIGHYHTGGNPGRAEIDDTQELNYPAIMRAIKATGFKGFVGQEFIPKRQPALDSLKAAVRLCRV